MRKYIPILLAVVFFSCDPNAPVKYMQFTSDDLSHLYYDKDTLTYIGQKINFTDTVYFLLNGSDTVVVAVQTEVHAEKSEWEFLNEEDIYGSSKIRFDNNTGFAWAEIDVMRNDERWNSRKYFQVAMANMNYDGFMEIINAQDTLQSLDTARINGKLYHDVYKLYGPIKNNYSHIKAVFFAKKYGYIMIESTEGKKLELIKKSKDTPVAQ